MDAGYMRLEREVAALQRRLQSLRFNRYHDRDSSRQYFEVKGLWARRKALLDSTARCRSR